MSHPIERYFDMFEMTGEYGPKSSMSYVGKKRIVIGTSYPKDCITNLLFVMR